MYWQVKYPKESNNNKKVPSTGTKSKQDLFTTGIKNCGTFLTKIENFFKKEALPLGSTFGTRLSGGQNRDK